MIVLWRITERCNLTCSFCAYDRRLNRPRHEADEQAIRRFGNVLEQYQRLTGDRVLVSWIGGEPLLFGPLEELTVLFKKYLLLNVSATTNGTALRSSKLRGHINEYYDELTISVDGIGPVHDEIRGWPGGYESLRENVTKLTQLKRVNGFGPRLRANVVLMQQTLSSFPQLCLELASWGIEEITFNQLGGRDRPEFFPSHRLLPNDATQLANLIPQLRRRLRDIGVILAGGTEYLERIKASSSNQTIPVLSCNPGERFLFVDENGIASPCHFTTDGYGVRVTELNSARALMDLPQKFAGMQSQKRLLACHDCHGTQVFSKFVA